MDFNQFLQQGAAHAWLYLPACVLLGALHGLEPGHSKTMMAAFIIAVRGTVLQAALLGLSAAISHSVVIWALAALALRFGSQWNVESTEPYFQIGTGVIVVGMALWTLWRLRRDAGHGHDHAHEEPLLLQSEVGPVELSIHEDGVPPRFRVISKDLLVRPTVLITVREDGASQSFHFVCRDNVWESAGEIPEPHAFRVELELVRENAVARASGAFNEDHVYDDDEEDDAHSRMHAEDIKRRFAGREVTTPQIVMFGLTGGLMPCPAALSILLICLQLKRFTLGFTLVAGFSVGLAVTLVTVGVVAAWSVGQVTKRSERFGRLAKKAPLFSAFLLIALGLFFVARGVMNLP